MVTLAELEGFRDKLIAARASGLSRMSISSPITQRQMEFRSDAELASALADIETRIASLRGQSAVQFVNFRSNSGW